MSRAVLILRALSAGERKFPAKSPEFAARVL